MGTEVRIGEHHIHAHEDVEGKFSIWLDNRQIGVYFRSTNNCVLVDHNGRRVLCLNVNTLDMLVETLREIR